MILRALLLVIGLLAASQVQALERPSAQSSRARGTATLDQVSIKPLVLFNMRGRKDPFMAYVLLTTTASTEYFTIAGLAYSGLLDVEGVTVALFRDNSGNTYSLKGSFLYGPDNVPLSGVRGRILAGKKVLLEQGERRLIYSSISSSKRLDSGPSR
jgi:hypothetical protein